MANARTTAPLASAHPPSGSLGSKHDPSAGPVSTSPSTNFKACSRRLGVIKAWYGESEGERDGKGSQVQLRCYLAI